MKRPLVYWPNDALKQPSRSLDMTSVFEYKYIESLVPDLVDTMLAHDGLGISAVQIGVPVRLIVVRNKKALAGYAWYANPVIIEKSGEPKLMREGCLSAPGVFEDVRRYPRVVVESERAVFDRLQPGQRGAPFHETATGKLAQVFQHELEHLAGEFFFKHLSGLRRARAYAKLTRTTPR